MSRRMRTWVVGLAAAAIVVAANASEGAYFSQSWGWVALAFLVPTTVALLLGVVEAPGVLRAGFAVLVAALGAWIAVSSLWSVSAAASLRETERVLVYVAIAVAVALLLRRGDAAGVAGGVFAGIVTVAGYGLATRLFADRFNTFDDPDLPYRLSEPVGYWNAFGLLAAMGVLLGLGLVAHARRLPVRVLAAAALPVLSAALYLAFSRGAWVALAAGYLAAVAVDPRRLRLLWTTLAVAPGSALVVAIASQQDALTTIDSPAADAIAEGREVARWLVLGVAASGALAVVGTFVARRVVPGRRLRRAIDVALALAVVGVVAVVVADRGGPVEALREVRERFDAPLVTRTPGDLNERLFNISGTGRSDSIGIAWELARERPVLGYGSGSFEYLWYERRPNTATIRDAHSLYAEMLAEVGVVGLALLALALALPLAAAVGGRTRPLVGTALGAYVAWVGHSALDWNWELPAVTMAALLAGSVGLLAGERRRGAPLADRARVPLAVGGAALSALAVVSLVGNQALFAGREAVARDEWASALEDARIAERLLPWSHEPAIVRGDAAAGLGDREAALSAYRDAVETNPRSWPAWLRLAQVARGDERTRAFARVRQLNPLEEELPGERRASP